MAYKDIKAVFDEFTTIKVDKVLINRIFGFTQTFVNKDEQHTNFFGSNLTGVYRAVWRDEYEGRQWLEEICGVTDIDALQDAIYELDDIDRKWKVASSATNLSFLYMAHRIQQSTLKEKDAGITYTIIIAHMKHLTSMMRRRFPHLTKEPIALAHYESLDYRSDIKKYGSWFNLLLSRGEKVVSKDFAWKEQLDTFQDTYSIVRWTNDLQDLLRKLMNALAESYYETARIENKINSASRVGEYEGVKVIGDVRNAKRDAMTRLKGKYSNEDDFIKEDLIDDTLTVITTSDPRWLRNTLVYMSENYRPMRDEIDKLSEELIIFMYDYAREEDIPMTDVPTLVARYRDLFRSSRTRRKDIIEIKALCRKLVEEAIPRARPAMLTATTTSLYMYLILRVFKMGSE